jgi:hypothetical protein
VPERFQGWEQDRQSKTGFQQSLRGSVFVRIVRIVSSPEMALFVMSKAAQGFTPRRRNGTPQAENHAMA